MRHRKAPILLTDEQGEMMLTLTLLIGGTIAILVLILIMAGG